MVNWLPNRGEGREEVPVPGSAIKYCDDRPTVRPSPELGADTAEDLREIAGYSPDEIEDLWSLDER